ncbi:MAG: hypothetical protein RTU92_10595, partial [Candidatus Thorarchaeota archaeon]
IGYQAYAGTYDDNLVFTPVEKLILSDYDYPPWENGYYFYDDILNGTKYLVNQTYQLHIYEYFYGGETFYSNQQYPYSEPIGEEDWVYYYRDIAGVWHNLTSYESIPKLETFKVVAYYNSSDYWFNFMGSDYRFYHTGYYTRAHLLYNSTSSQELFLDVWNQGYGFKPVYQFDYKGFPILATAEYEMVHRVRDQWGYALEYGPTPLLSVVHKSPHSLYIGIPDWGMWGVKNWIQNPETGALDLDGDLETVDDQYFVQEDYASKNTWSESWERLYVHINWDPNQTLYGDEMNINSWMGLQTYTWSNEWNQSFYWYDADTMELLDETEMNAVRDEVLSPEGDPLPGYWDIAWMMTNTTWDDIVAEAQENGWDWIEEEQSWTWLTFGISQNYGMSFYDPLAPDEWGYAGINMHYEFSGLMLWDDLNENGLMDASVSEYFDGELTHYLMPESVDSIEFVTPGAAFGNYLLQDSLSLDLEEEVTWGVAFIEVNGTVYPFNSYGYFGWYDGIQTGNDYLEFNERPTKVTIDELSFLVHFQGYIEEEAENNYADIKVDNYVGNWDVDMVGNRDNLENRSLALNYLADVSLYAGSYSWDVEAEGEETDNNNVFESDVFDFLVNDAPFAEMIMGGVTYDWSKNTTAPYNVSSHTTPYTAFEAAFRSEGGETATSWSFTSTMYYVTIAFPEWDGYSVFQDPVFVGYVSSRGGGSGTQSSVHFTSLGISPDVPIETDPVQVTARFAVDEGVNVLSVTLYYSTDEATWQSVAMTDAGLFYFGDIPAFTNGTQVWYYVEVVTTLDTTLSETKSYIVGQGAVTVSTPTEPTTPPPTGGPGFDSAIIILLAGGAVVVVIVAGLVMRRRK